MPYFLRVKLFGIYLIGVLLLSLSLSAAETTNSVPQSSANTELFEAAHRGDPSGVEAALAAGAQVNSWQDGRTPLLETLRLDAGPVTDERRRVVAMLLDHGADMGAADPDGRNVLICATILGDLELVRTFVEKDIYVKTRDRFHKPALFYAVDAGRRDIVDYLSRNGDLQSLPVWDQRQQRQHSHE